MRFAIMAVIILVFFGGLAFLGFTVYDFMLEALEPADPAATEPVPFQVEPGSSTSDVGAALAREGIVRDGVVFSLYARYRGYDGRLQAGWYALSPAMSPEEILQSLVEGEVADRTVTVPEGLKISQVIELLHTQGIGTEEALERALSDASLVEDWLPADYAGEDPLEGYLLPDTYRISWEAGPEEVVERMVREFDAFWTEERLARAEELDMTVHEVVTLASIIERETGAPGEREKVSGVFHNRLDIGMRLEACATVHYAIGRPGGTLTNADLETDSPYNTYRKEGLPPGPIASPGVASLRAALYPEEVPYYYFVAKDDGTHAFAETFAGHEANIQKYR